MGEICRTESDCELNPASDTLRESVMGNANPAARDLETRGKADPAVSRYAEVDGPDPAQRPVCSKSASLSSSLTLPFCLHCSPLGACWPESIFAVNYLVTIYLYFHIHELK